MQTEEWMKRRKEEQRILRAHNILTKQVNENIEELESRNDNLSSDNQHISSDLSFENNFHDVLRAHIEFNTRLVLKLEKRVKKLEKKIKSFSSW